MPIIGNQTYQSAFVTDTFSGNGSTTAFTMSVAPAGTSSVLVVVSGVLQDPSTYSVIGNTLTFTGAPPTGTGNISVRYLGVPASGVTTTAYRTVTEFTATANQTTFTPPSYTVGFINVYRSGVRLGSADYTASNGTTVVLATGATAGDLVTVESFLVSSVLNAIPAITNGVIDSYVNSVSASKLTGTRTIPTITMPAGSVIQTAMFLPSPTALTLSSTGGNYANLTISNTSSLATVSFTPLFATSKILIMVKALLDGNTATGYEEYFSLFRGSTFLSAHMWYRRVSGDEPQTYVINYLDSPSTNSAITYDIRMAAGAGTPTVYINRDAGNNSSTAWNNSSTIIIQEIAG